MKVTLLAVVTLTTVAALVGAADPECIYRKIRGLSTHWPKPLSCSSYYRCSSKNNVRTVTCPVGKEYNPKNGKCSNAGRSLCKLSLVAPLAETTNVCSKEVNGAYLAKSGTCAEFYICDEQLAYPQKCDSGSYFNETLSACLPDPASTCWQNLCIGKASGVSLANKDNCGSYYVCSDAEATLQTCPSGSFFNTTVDACTVDTGNSQCWVNYCIGKADGSAVADKSSCSLFYVCSDNTATAQECPEGSHFENTDWGCVPGECSTESTTEPCEDITTTTTEPCEDVTTTTTEPCEDVTTTTTEPCEDSTTTEPPTSCDCGDVKNSDIISDADNCRKYFICTDGALKAGDCGKGNLFNSTLKVCVVDEKNECCVADCAEGATEVDPQDCSKYLKCVNGEWTSTPCEGGSYYNSLLNICEVDENKVCIGATTTTNQCNARDPPASGKNCWSYQACIDGQWQDETCLKDYYFDASVGICREDSDHVCPENRSSGSRQKRSVEDCTCEGGIEQGSIVSHPTDCDKYLICENGQLVEGLCGVGNVFKNCSGVCAPDTKATCWVCSNKPNGYQMPNPTDCTSYLTCWNGLATEHFCEADEWYNGAGECAIDVNAKCINPCTCGNGNVAHPICTKYFQCTDGVAQAVQCPSGEAFDSSTGLCSATVACSAKNCATASDDTTYPVAGDSTKFYLCRNNVATIASCPANSAYDVDLGICQSQPSTDCDQTVCKTAAEWSAYPSLSNDSSTFCECQDGGGYINSCPTGLFFDEAEAICTFTGNCDPRECKGESEYYVSQDYEDPNSFCLCRANEPVSVPCPIGYTFDSKELQCVLIPQADPRCCRNGCVGKSDFTYLPALDTTDGFCVCVDEVPKYTSCPADSQYDTELGACFNTGSETTCEKNVCDATACETKPDYDTFSVEGEPSAFCYCLDYCPIYRVCSNDLVYDPEQAICTEPVDPCAVSKCDAEKCDVLSEYTPYLPNEGVDGFCYCEGGLPNFLLCPNDQEFSTSLGICQTPVDNSAACECDASKCATLSDYVPFPTNSASENSDSFCYCENDEVFLGKCSADMVFFPKEERCGPVAASECVCEAGKCDNSDDYYAYGALNTVEGFCLCVIGTPVFNDCPEGASFDSDLAACVGGTTKITASSICDHSRCNNRALLAAPFAAINTTSGYCSCQDVGVSTFVSCADEHVYEQSMGSCVIASCDYTNCLNRAPFEAFEAMNTTEGFCSCDGVPSFHHCEKGFVFDKVQGLCQLKNVIAMISCNLQECLKRGQFEPFAAENTKSGFCSCDDQQKISVTYHPCALGQIFDPELGLCASHSIQKRSVEAEENVRSLSLFKKYFPKLF
ncbi:chitin-binding domain protein cbd-1 [Drosophila rhopaloa]|uniref:Multiple epidermal growth factor-like domains protein 6 n=1 Tax=Drosophila rhopaloa TaxID=1041015 RepID=A0A6P4E8E3_DRORH|nr:chitin-binding domain protein cbd-1 [Drosophila rhopaloa]